MNSSPTPVLSWQVSDGETYWAARGDTQWSAVRIIGVQRKRAEVERIIPRTGEVIHRKGKVKLDELVRRDPKLKGKDKPTVLPKEVFATVRANRLKEAEKPAKPEVASPIIAKPQPKKKKVKESKVSEEALDRLFELLEDKSTDSDWV